MNPYEVLGVGKDASEHEIKTAYRSLAKKYHPDRNHTDEAKQRIKDINEAYEILSDPTKKSAYDNQGNYDYQQTETYVYEEDAREVYRREYLRRKSQEAKEKRERELILKKKIHRFLWLLSSPLLLLALVLLIDYFLPTTTYHEPALRGWQQRLSYSRNSRGPLVSYIETENFILEVPSEIHINYDYDRGENLIIEATPILKAPRLITATINNQYYSFSSPGTVYVFGIALPCLLFISSLVVLLKRDFSMLVDIMSYAQIVFAIIVIVKMYH